MIEQSAAEVLAFTFHYGKIKTEQTKAIDTQASAIYIPLW